MDCKEMRLPEKRLTRQYRKYKMLEMLAIGMIAALVYIGSQLFGFIVGMLF